MRSGVLRLKCPDGTAVYIGQTVRSLHCTLQEHEMTGKAKKPEKSNFTSHLIDSGHVFERDSGVALLNENEKSKT